MSKTADIFQVIACMTATPKGDLKLAVTESLKRVEEIDAGARQVYAGRLARRARHHQAEAGRQIIYFDGLNGIDASNATDENCLRDFYHAVYYAAFFVGRFALINAGSHDCTDHHQIGSRLGSLGTKGAQLRQDAEALSVALDSWRPVRTVADYTMSDSRLKKYADLGAVKTQQVELDALFVVWQVP